MSDWLGSPEGAEIATVEAREAPVCPASSSLVIGPHSETGALSCAYDDGNGMWINPGVASGLETITVGNNYLPVLDARRTSRTDTPIYHALNSARDYPSAARLTGVRLPT